MIILKNKKKKRKYWLENTDRISGIVPIGWFKDFESIEKFKDNISPAGLVWKGDHLVSYFEKDYRNNQIKF